MDVSESSLESNNNIIINRKNNTNKNNKNKKGINNKKSLKKSYNKNKTSKKEKEKNSNRSKNGIVKNLSDILIQKHKKFQFLKPFTTIKDEKLLSCLKKSGYDLENILILTNKSKFKLYIDDLITTLGNLINNILPEKFKLGKRQGIRLNEKNEFDISKITSVKDLQDNEIQKNIIHFGNPNLKTVINIMIGIKSAVSKIGSIPIKNLDLKISYLFPVDNLGVYEEMNRFIYEQNNYDGIVKCRFYDSAPKIFYNLRTLYGITNADYL